MYSVYALVDPRDQSIRYVGMSKNVWRRYAMHLLVPSKTTPQKNAWIEELRKVDLSPLLSILETMETEGKARERETFWIRHHIKNNAPLTNVIKTGKSCPTRAKILVPGARTVDHDLLKIEEVAEFIGLRPFTVRKYLREGVIPATKLDDGTWLVKASDVEAYITKRTYTPEQSQES